MVRIPPGATGELVPVTVGGELTIVTNAVLGHVQLGPVTRTSRGLLSADGATVIVIILSLFMKTLVGIIVTLFEFTIVTVDPMNPNPNTVIMPDVVVAVAVLMLVTHGSGGTITVRQTGGH